MKTLVLTIACLCSLCCFSQLPDYHVQLFDESFGVRTSEVRKVLVDQHGFVWILHDDRVQRFDGKQITDFVIDASLTSIFCDRHDRVWVSSASQLHLFFSDKQGFVPIQVDTIKNLGIVAVCQFTGEEVWVVSSKGFYVLDRPSMTFKKHTDPALGNISYVQIRGMDVSRNAVFFSAPDSLIVYHLRTKTRRALPLPEFNIRTVTALGDDLAFVSIWKGIVYLYDFSKEAVTEIDMREHLSNVQDYFVTIFQVQRLSSGNFLLATTKGLLEYNLRTGDFRKLNLYHKGKPLEGNIIFMDIYVDQTGTAWVAYTNYGLLSFKLDASEIGLVRNYETEISKAWDNHVRDFAEDEYGNLWMGTFNGFACWDVHQGIVTPYFAEEGATNKVNHPSIRGIVYDGTHLILGQTNRGVWLYNPKTKKYQRPSYLPDADGERTKKRLEGSFIDQIYTLQNGNHVICGSNAAYLLNGTSYVVTEIDFPGKSENQDFCYQEGSLNIWIGTTKNLYYLDSNLTYRFKINREQTEGIINTLCEWNDSTLIAGGNGLWLIKVRDTIPEMRRVHPFFDELGIYTVYRDINQKLWLATSEGLFRFDPATKQIESFSNFESIVGNSFYPNSYCYSSQGLLFLGSSRGIIYLDPQKIGASHDTLNVFITRVGVNEDDTSFTATSGETALKYFQNNIAFDFIAPYYSNATKLRYRYRLKGLDTTWISNRNSTTVRFHTLQPGNYEFKAAASINGIDWFESKDMFAFNISPPFWKTWWFSALTGVAFAMLIYMLYRYQLNKKLEVERLRMGIARDLHDDIGSALSNIHIISSMATKKQAENGTSAPAFAKIRDSSKAILENMQDIVWAINPDNDTLAQVLAKMKEFAGELCESAGIEYAFHEDANLENTKLTVYKRKNLFLVFKEAMNNAVKYSGGTHIAITLRSNTNGWLTLQIMDNGSGFIHEEVHKGNGIRNMQERAKEVKGQMYLKSGNGHGTLVEFSIPVR